MKPIVGLAPRLPEATEAVALQPPPEGWRPTIALLAILWLPVLNQLRVEWSINAQYAYGWAVPILALYLLAERWKVRPPTSPTISPRLLLPAVLPLILLWLPIRVVQEATPDWRLVSWAMAGQALLLSLAALHFAGGTRWVRHFFFPVAFLLVAVPWPVPLEQSLIQALMRGVAAICVEALGWAGIPATLHGNIIAISTGVVGVEEACSGVRSLQTTFMASLFLGELLHFGLLRRAAMIAAGLALAFACNAARAFTLVWLTASDGPDSVHRWHDTIGLSVLLVSLAGLALLAFLLHHFGEKARVPDARDPACDPVILSAAPAESKDLLLLPLPRAQQSKRSFDSVPLPLHCAQDNPKALHLPSATASRLPTARLLLPLIAWLLLVEAANELWYRAHERHLTPAIPWTIAWPETEPHYHPVEIPEIARAILRYTTGRSAAWTSPTGDQASMVFLQWAPGRASAQLATAHGPEICLPATGATLRADLGVSDLPIRGLHLPTHRYIFTARGRPLYVFYCLWENRPALDGPPSTWRDLTVTRRLRGVLTGQRNLGQQVLELALTGPTDQPTAELTVRQLLEKVIR